MPLEGGRSEFFPNEVRAVVRGRYNAFAQAIVTLNEGSVDPADTVSGMYRVSTLVANYPQFQRRNNTDDGWEDGVAYLRMAEAIRLGDRSVTLSVVEGGSQTDADPFTFGSIEAALSWVRERHVATDVTINVATGTYTLSNSLTGFPHGANVSIVGAAPTGTYPALSNEGGTNRENRNTSNTTLLVAHYPVKIQFSSASPLIDLSKNAVLDISNVCFVNTGSSTNGATVEDGSCLKLRDTAFCNFEGAGLSVKSGNVLVRENFVVTGGVQGLQLNPGSRFIVDADNTFSFRLLGSSGAAFIALPGAYFASMSSVNVVILGCAGFGLRGFEGAEISINGGLIVRNTGSGAIIVTGTKISSNQLDVSDSGNDVDIRAVSLLYGSHFNVLGGASVPTPVSIVNGQDSGNLALLVRGSSLNVYEGGQFNVTEQGGATFHNVLADYGARVILRTSVNRANFTPSLDGSGNGIGADGSAIIWRQVT